MKNEIILFENQNVKLEVNMKDETVWLTQEQMGILFCKSKSTINEHIKNIYKEKELEEQGTIKTTSKRRGFNMAYKALTSTNPQMEAGFLFVQA